MGGTLRGAGPSRDGSSSRQLGCGAAGSLWNPDRRIHVEPGSKPHFRGSLTCLTVLASLGLFAVVGESQIPEDARSETLDVQGLNHPVEILKDRWGISHIYAETEYDLFFGQGWNAARDRLFQLEIWRRQATGTVAEILGERELDRDRGARLFRFRGDLEQELRHYHPRGVEIVGAFVDGINAYVRAALEDPSLLSVEFDMLGIRPGLWTPEVVISRHQGLLGNITGEVRTGKAVAALGAETVRSFSVFEPHEPILELDAAVDREHLLETDVLRLYNAFRSSIDFRPEHVTPGYRRAGSDGDGRQASASFEETVLDAAGAEVGSLARVQGPQWDPTRDLGSNNWVVSGALTESGYPFMANDPHRSQSAPSLRYWVHLVGPGWDVIGGGEPVLPGVSIGHNQYGAWGLTVFRTDGEDLYTYRLHPDDPDLYRYRGGWEAMTVVLDTIPVRGRDPEVVELRYTRHGPVVHQDSAAAIAYAVRAAWLEPGGAPYLASLRMDQAASWEEFREACTWSNIPGENMVWAGRDGTIGWQSVGIAPIRPNFSGLVPVPGDGRYEWGGYLPIEAKPNRVDPPEGFIATANNNLTSPDYPFLDAIGYEWSDPWRWMRAAEVLGSGRRFTLMDMMLLQTDELSIPARTLVPLLEPLAPSGRGAQEARRRLLGWDFVLDRTSVEAGIYVAWERRLAANLYEALVPPDARAHIRSIPMRLQVEWLLRPDGRLGADPIGARDTLLLESLDEALGWLTEQFGPESEDWVFGQEGYKHALIRHPLARAVNEDWRERLNVGPAARGGYGYTLNANGMGNNQTSGASFRIIVDTSDWDRTVGMNNPGQGGDPEGPHYRDLFDLWSADRFHPVFYTRSRVEGVTGERLLLTPGER
jgi:penicillin amidase